MLSIARPLTVLLLLLMVGCIPSLHAVYTDRDLVFVPEIVGFWKQKKSPATWDFSKRNETSYQLRYTDQSGRSGRFIAHVCRVDDAMFLDLYPEKEDVDASAFYKFHLLPIHTVYLVKQTSPTLELVSIDLKWFKDYLNEHPEALAHSTVNGQKLVTASSKELQQFLLEHRDRFTGSFHLVRQKADAPAEVSK